MSSGLQNDDNDTEENPDVAQNALNLFESHANCILNMNFIALKEL